MRIGIDARLWNETGVGRYIRNLVEWLRVLDHTNSYVLFVGDAEYQNIKDQILKIKNARNWKVVKVNIRWHTLEEQVKFPIVINKENLDLMHFPYFSVPVFYRKPFVVTIHDLILHNFPTGEASTLPLPLFKAKLSGYKFVVSRAAKKAKKIIVPTEAVKDEIVKRLKVPQEKVVVTYCGVDSKISNIKYQISNKYKIPNVENKKYFLYVGNAYPHKNLKTLIAAFKMFKFKDKNDVKLILAGRKDYFYKIIEEEIIKAGEKDIKVLSPEEDAVLSSLYQNALALVVPSFMEGFGLTALEAMINKCPVIASDIPVLKEVCKDASIFFDPNSPEDLKDKMLDIYKNPDRYKKNINKGLERIKKFSWEKMAQETLQIYSHILSNEKLANSNN